jgi:tetratricopeptide (TPR) repeat protein
MNQTIKPKLVFFQSKPDENLANFVLLHRLQHVKCLSFFFEVVVINEDCDYQQICDKYQPDLALFEHPGNFPSVHKLRIKNTHMCSHIPKVGLHNEDTWCSSRKAFITEMEQWGIETFFSICTTAAEHTPEIADNLFVWPNFIDAEVYRDYCVDKVIPILLTGASYALYPWRQKIYNLVSQNYPSLICPHLGYGEGSAFRMLHGEQYARTINASWFVPTCGTVAKEIVRKHFEIPASKACLITEQSPALEAAGFIDMKNCVFVDEHNVLDKLDYLFRNLDELESVINAGYQLAHSRHTLKQRDQIFQWFTLHRNLKPDQKIIQTNPFESLIVVEKNSGIKSAHVICNGLHLTFLHKADENLWAGQYDEAEALYFKCLNHVSIMPEPKLRLALCSLYKGDAKTALEWLVSLIQPNLDDDRVSSPDPVEWAYCIISLLCLGKTDEAVRRCEQFSSINHPELNYIRRIISILRDGDNRYLLQHEQTKRKYSIHILPERTFNEWIEQLCIMLRACQQDNLVEILINSINLGVDSSQPTKDNASATLSISEKYKVKRSIFSRILLNINPYPFKNQLIIKARKGTSELRKKPVIKECFGGLKNLQNWLGSSMRHGSLVQNNDEFFQNIQKITKGKEIKTVLVIGSSTEKNSTAVFLKAVLENVNKPTVCFISNEKTHIDALQTQSLDLSDPAVNFYHVPSTSLENYQDQLKHSFQEIKKENKISVFDIILIDGLTTQFIPELNEFDESTFIVIDNTNTLEGHKYQQNLIADMRYSIEFQNPCLRGGYAIFRRIS